MHALGSHDPLFVHEKYAGHVEHDRGLQWPDEHDCVGGQSPSDWHGGEQ